MKTNDLTQIQLKDFETAAQALCDKTYNKHGNYGFAAGYLQSLASSILRELPSTKRQQFIDQLRRTNEEFFREIAA